MGTYNSAVITNGGQSMIAQAVAGASLEFTTIKTSNYAYPAGTNLATLTTINGIKQSKDITGATVYNSRVIKISATVDNTGISTAYTINTIGIYAKVGSSAESLFAVVTASAADTMPAYDSKPYSYIYEINLTMQNAANVTVTVNAAGLVNVADLNAAKVEIQGEIADLKSQINKHGDANYDGYAYAMTAADFVLGKWSEITGNANERTAWIRSGFLDNTKLYKITILGSTTRVEVLKYNLDGTYASDWAEYNSGTVTIQPSETYKYKLNLRTYPEADITDIQAFLDVNATLYYGDLFSTIRKDLTQTEQAVTEIGRNVSVIETTLYGESTDPIAFESGKWSESTGNANSNTKWVRTADFLAQGGTIAFAVAEGAQAFLLEYSGAGVYSGNYTQYNAGSYRIVLPGANKYKLNARNYPETEITNVSVFIENYLEISYESTPGLVQKVDAITPPDSFWSVPDTVYALVGQEFRIYFNEIFTTTQPGFFEISVTGATYPEVTYSSEYISLNFASAKSCTVAISYQDMMRHEISAKTITVSAVATIATIPAKKYMFLGDSLTNEGTMVSTFKTLMGDSAVMYGTRTSKSTQHEGRPGWGVTHYCDNSTYNGITNPFYNPTTGKFDFTYYMSTNPTYADVEVVNIFLGRNNGYQTNIISRLYNEIIASIHAYNSGIIVTLMCAYNTATDNSGCGATLQNTYRFIYNGKVYNQAFIDFFKSKTSEHIFIVPQNLNFDNYYDYTRAEQDATPYDSTDKRIVFTDNVHPATSGYVAWAHTLFANMQNILNN